MKTKHTNTLFLALSLLLISYVSVDASGFEKSNKTNKELEPRTFSIYKTHETESKSFSFSAESTLGDFEGTTDDVTGAIIFENIEDLNGASFNFWIPLDSLSTGMGMRDNIMKGDCLETDKFPFAEMNGSIIRVVEKTENHMKLSAIGDLLVHGKINPVFFYIELRENDGRIHLQTSFSIKMSDFGIERPSLLFVTVEDKLDFAIDLTLKNDMNEFAVND